ncbi:hypothetical protein BDV93DRAFT_595943 [Ceratobasidium sp. AG-I]|nr:hypothetical protein BDV93DRAFT_595943 [Ceratobasidium sp. AG-I]
MEFGDEALGSVEIAQSDANDSVEAQTCTTVEMRKITKGMTTEERTDESDGAQDDVSLPDSSGINIWLGAFSNLDHPDAMAEMMSLVGGVIASDESSSPGADGETINWWETLRDSLSFDDFDLPTLDMLIEASSQQDLLSDSSDPQLATRLLMHSQLLLARATVLDAESDVDRAITCLSRAAQVSRGEPTTRIDILRELSSAHKRRFQKYGRAEDINSAIEYQQQNIACAGDKHEEYGVLITNLGILLRLRYKVTGDLNDIHAAIERETFALSLIPEIDDNRPVLLANLGSSYRYRFERLGELEDLSKAISFQAQAIQLTSEGHPNMPIHLGHLGNSHMSRFERLGKLDDVTQAIACYSQAVQLTPEGHPDMPGRLDNLGNSYRYRFKHLGQLNSRTRLSSSPQRDTKIGLVDLVISEA